ncbi:hypothetical protein [Salinimicrobium gaetbulicola]|uniref:Outer membrane protein with beta-barrel domain n=1 Tax=Salinimicrobium gaetbulicola TaxID=999702 RepID=A0ABW3IHI0_9FLAO
MRRIEILFIVLLLFTGSISAQEVFIIEGDTLSLKREVKGTLSLYWAQKDQDYRYFIQKYKRMAELKNSEVEGVNQEEFKAQLADFTSDAEIDTRDVKFLLYSLKHFVNRYNALVQEEYSYNAATANIKHRLSLFTGLSNNRYTENPENKIAPILGLEFEFYDPNLARRHAAFLQLRQSFKRDDYHYGSTQFSINYRFRPLIFEKFDIHIDAELATFIYSEDQLDILDETGNVVAVNHDSGLSFKAPLSFGIGTDYRVTEASYITFSYNDIVSLVLDSNGSFPIDFTIGYKFNL